jgi:Fe-S-cluster-containing hydrogenase component 2
VSIPDALRARMYADDYQAPRLVGAAAAEAGNLGACLTCDASPCSNACPHGVAIGAHTRRAAELARRA